MLIIITLGKIYKNLICLIFNYILILAKKSGRFTNNKSYIIELEEIKNQLIEKVNKVSSNFCKLSDYYNFFNKVISYNNPNLNQAYLQEFIDDYLLSISRFDVWGTEPKRTEAILSQLKNLSEFNFFADKLANLEEEIGRIEKQLEGLNRKLHISDSDKNEDEGKDNDKMNTKIIKHIFL